MSNAFDVYLDTEVTFFEGERGVRELSKLLKVLGYGSFGSPLEEFLADNSGAVEQLYDFISQHATAESEWGESIAAYLDSE